MKKLCLVFLSCALLSSCGTIHRGYLPGSSYVFYPSQEMIDLKDQSYKLEFKDARNELVSLKCSKHKVDKKSELNGKYGFSLFKSYIKEMTRAR